LKPIGSKTSSCSSLSGLLRLLRSSAIFLIYELNQFFNLKINLHFCQINFILHLYHSDETFIFYLSFHEKKT